MEISRTSSEDDTVAGPGRRFSDAATMTDLANPNDLVGEELVQGVAIVPQRDPGCGQHLCHVDARFKVHDIFALGVHLHKDFGLSHWLDHLANVRARLLEQLQPPHLLL